MSQNETRPRIDSIDWWPKQDMSAFYHQDAFMPLNMRPPQPRIRIRIQQPDGSIEEIEATMDEMLAY